MRVTIPWHAFALFILAHAACASSKGPEQTLEAYEKSLTARDTRALYALMQPSFRQQHSYENFSRSFKSDPDGPDELAARLRGPRRRTVNASAATNLGDSLELRLENGSWKIIGNPLDFYSRDSPIEALRSFVRAYQLHRWDIMLTLVPERYRRDLSVKIIRKQFESDASPEIARMMRSLSESLDRPVDIFGDRAELHYGDGAVASFAREGEHWVVVDPG